MRLGNVGTAASLVSRLSSVEKCRELVRSSAGHMASAVHAAEMTAALSGVDHAKIATVISEAVAALLDAEAIAINGRLTALGVDTTPSAA